MQHTLFPLDDPTKSLRAAPLTRKQIHRAEYLSRLLWECGDDVAFWCERLGYDVFERPLPKGISAFMRDGFIFLRKGMTHIDQVLSVAHEIFHIEFHATASAYRELADAEVELQESQAESFAVLVGDYDMKRYSSVQQFNEASPLPDNLKPLRLKLSSLIHQ